MFTLWFPQIFGKKKKKKEKWRAASPYKEVWAELGKGNDQWRAWELEARYRLKSLTVDWRVEVRYAFTLTNGRKQNIFQNYFRKIKKVEVEDYWDWVMRKMIKKGEMWGWVEVREGNVKRGGQSWWHTLLMIALLGASSSSSQSSYVAPLLTATQGFFIFSFSFFFFLFLFLLFFFNSFFLNLLFGWRSFAVAFWPRDCTMSMSRPNGAWAWAWPWESEQLNCECSQAHGLTLFILAS